MSDSNILQVFTEGFDSVKNMFSHLDGKMDELKIQNQDLKDQLEDATKQITDLEARLLKLEKKNNADSSNSHWPSSTDKLKHKKVVKSLREKSGKNSGGQPGHKGTTLEFSANPTQIIVSAPNHCEDCGASLGNTKPQKIERRQVFDLPKPQLAVTEYQSHKVVCPVCGNKNQGSFPKHVTQPTQYGPHMTSFIVYLHQYQLLPFKRLSELTSDLFGQKLSEGTLVTMVKRVGEALKPIEEYIKIQVIQSKVNHFDETGCYVGMKRWWLHVASNKRYTHYGIDQSRGQEATDKIGILPAFKGTGVHDNWKTYFRYDFNHALCNVHHLRELNSVIERFDQQWAIQMKDLLLEAKNYADTHEYPLIPPVTKRFEKRYSEIIELGMSENPIEKSDKFKDAQNLLWRFEKRQEEILEFLHQREVPFSNNLAESDIRMTKVKQKISGTFRTQNGADQFARIRGFISTCQKQSVHILNGIYDVLTDNPCSIQ